MSTDRRTPSPWALEETINARNPDPASSRFIWADALPGEEMPKDFRAVCTVHAESGVGRDHNANAEFIVKACNAHDVLVSALQELISLRDRPHGFPDPSWYEPAFEQARAALASVQS